MPVPQPRDGSLEVDGLRLHYLEWGDQSLPSMVLLHGTASHAHVWDRFAAAFEAEFHVVALDQRGHGESEWPEDCTVGYPADIWVRDLKSAVDQLSLAPIVLVGVSAGGNTAIHYAATHPGDVDRLVIVEMGPEAAREGVTRVLQSIPRQEVFDNLEEGIKYLGGPGGRADPELARGHAVNALRTLPDGRVALKGDPSLRRSDWRRPLRKADDNWRAVRAVSCPSLLIRGSESKLLAVETAAEMQRQMQSCTFVTIEGAGHAVPLHRPTEFEHEVKSWLRATNSS